MEGSAELTNLISIIFSHRVGEAGLFNLCDRVSLFFLGRTQKIYIE